VKEQSIKIKEEYYHFRNHVGLVLSVVPSGAMLHLSAELCLVNGEWVG
jgi:hypothetical protein